MRLSVTELDCYMQGVSSRKAEVCERRRDSRIGFDCPLRWNDGGADRVGWARDMSESGVGFVTRSLSAPRPGQRVRLMMELDSEHEWLVDTEAKVVRSEPREHGLCEVGVQLSRTFTDLVDI